MADPKNFVVKNDSLGLIVECTHAECRRNGSGHYARFGPRITVAEALEAMDTHDRYEGNHDGQYQTPDAAGLHERLRVIGLLMHGLDGHADACEDNGEHDEAAALREITRQVRAVLPNTADPKAFTFGWALRFTAPSGRAYEYDMPSEFDARQALDGHTEGAERWTLLRRILGPWTEVRDA